jgi:hypothetical protein
MKKIQIIQMNSPKEKTRTGQNLEHRLINFSVDALRYAERLPDTYGARHLGQQLIRSSSAPNLMGGEAQFSESKRVELGR